MDPVPSGHLAIVVPKDERAKDAKQKIEDRFYDERKLHGQIAAAWQQFHPLDQLES